jgi:hypothetical protein
VEQKEAAILRIRFAEHRQQPFHDDPGGTYIGRETRKIGQNTAIRGEPAIGLRNPSEDNARDRFIKYRAGVEISESELPRT